MAGMLSLVAALGLALAGAKSAAAAVATDPILTIAGTGERGVLGDGYDARQAQLRFAGDVAIAPNGDVYVADPRARRVRRIDGTGVMTTVAGTGLTGALGDAGPATKASLIAPSDLAFDAAGNLYISDSDAHRVRRVDTAGIITTVAGNGEYWLRRRGRAGHPGAASLPGRPGGRTGRQPLHRRRRREAGLAGRSRRDHHPLRRRRLR
jgi:hypothetical protein